jgi:hypothetical protein
LICQASEHAAAFLRGLELSGARPKELAEAVASDFDGKRLKLSHRKGRPPRLRSRYVVLDADADGVVFFKSQAEGKTANDYLLFRSRGKGLASCYVGGRAPHSNFKTQPDSSGSTGVPAGASAYGFRRRRLERKRAMRESNVIGPKKNA